MSWTAGPRPDITPPQIVAAATAGIPILASLLSAFGVYDLSQEQQDALNDAVTWAGVVASALIGGDAIIRTARNHRIGEVEKALVEGGETNLEVVNSVTDGPSQAVAPAAIPAASGSDPANPHSPTGFESPPTNP